MFILTILVVAGFVSNKCGLMGGDFDRKLSNFIINVSCPCLILSSVMGSELPDRTMIAPLLVVGFITYILLFGICYYLPKLFVKNPDSRGIYSFMLMFANVGFIGYPVVSSIFSPKAVFYAALLNMPNALFIFVIGTVFVLGGSKIRFDWRTFYCPALVASYIAIVIVVAGWDGIPRIVSEPLCFLGNITVPGALLIIGSSMAHIGRRQMLGSGEIYIMTAFRLLLIPAALFGLFYLCGVSNAVNEINTVVIAMPVASFGTMFCLKYNRDDREMVQGTLITTLLSIFTIPLITYLFKVAI